MADFTKEIERPLGQSVRASASRSARRFGRGQMVAALGVLAIVGASALIAFGEKPFRKPEVVATPVPQETKPVETATQIPAASEVSPKSAPQPKKSSGPQIIHVQPTDSGGQAGIVIQDASAVGQNLSVAHLPDKALIEDGEGGPLPIRSADGRRPFDVYARPWSGARGARVAIVIGGLAVSQTGTQSAIAKLPGEVTLAFASQGNSIGRWMQEARRRGHEIVMQLPLEPFDYPNVNPGRNTLTVDAGEEENLKNLRWVLSRTTNYTAVMNYMGARFSTDPEAFGPVMAELAKRGIGYLDDGSSARSVAPDLAKKDGVPLAIADTAIDGVQERGAILKKLDELEATARAKGYALGTGSAFNVTVDAVVSWVNEAKKRGIEIVPVSAVATDPERK
ncbi:divergent polysaccharide deacetylase family protein [Mesorhizobium sp. NPDC059054]|uniref:divergent polysaccharide deacetylase family protein n=1 Tax=Mesorhizobium sp. NPDC059054 TaxID=3346711 RepID=UPI00367ED327